MIAKPKFICKLVLSIGLVLLLTASAAHAGGLGVTNLDRRTSGAGIAAPDGSAHYYARPLDGRTRIVKAQAGLDRSGRTLDSAVLEGTLAVPAITYQTTTGMSADGSTLVLIEPRRGSRSPTTRLVVLDTERMQPTATAELDGYFGVYAVSPDGGSVYLIHYRDPDWDARKNEVIVYDVAAGRLRPGEVVDRPGSDQPRLRGEVIARATSPDGVWAYTLYGREFISALNTATAASTRIDIKAEKRKHGLVVSPNGATISVLGGQHGRTVAKVEFGTWRVTEPAARKVSPARAAPPQDDRSRLPAWWAAPAIGLGLALFIAAHARRRRCARGLPEDPLPDLGLGSAAEAERKRDPIG